MLDSCWEAAQNYLSIRFYEDKYIFPIALMRDDGETPLEVSIKYTGTHYSSDKEWSVVHVNTYVKPMQTLPRKEIEKFAWMGDWGEFLKELSDIALSENWTFKNFNGETYENGLLKNYICNTFFD